MDEFKNKILKSKTFDSLYDIRLNQFIGEKIKKIHYDKIKLGIINIPCGGYGDVIKCIKVYDYLREYDTIGRGQHMLNNIDSEIWKNNVRFTIVRNPYDRIVSSYLEICSFYRDDFNENALKSFKSYIFEL